MGGEGLESAVCTGGFGEEEVNCYNWQIVVLEDFWGICRVEVSGTQVRAGEDLIMVYYGWTWNLTLLKELINQTIARKKRFLETTYKYIYKSETRAESSYNSQSESPLSISYLALLSESLEPWRTANHLGERTSRQLKNASRLALFLSA